MCQCGNIAFLSAGMTGKLYHTLQLNDALIALLLEMDKFDDNFLLVSLPNYFYYRPFITFSLYSVL